ncbi:MAG TPA: hypothetical protein VGC41_24630 [Kofleriaceae bacterium]
MAKDRAAPFSKKHRRYWIPVTGGMIVIGLINVMLGLHSYKAPVTPQRIELELGKHDAGTDAANTMGNKDLPADVMRAFSTKYPRVLPMGAVIYNGNFVISFPPGAAHTHATFDPAGTFVSED